MLLNRKYGRKSFQPVPTGKDYAEKEIFHDGELYDYIFFFEKDSLKMVPLLKGHLFENAKMNVVLPYTQIMDTAVKEQEIKGR